MAGSVFTVGGRDLVVPELSPWALRDIQLRARDADFDDPAVREQVALDDVFAMLGPAYPDLTQEWLEENIEPETVTAIYENLVAQVRFALAAGKGAQEGKA